MSSYSGLSRAALSFEYLHTNSTTHEFLFGALAELIDNSKDARSKKIEIYSERNEDLRGGYMLCFLDDGCGMNREEAHHVITFGRSAKKAMDTNVVGQYGNGLKSGSMRVAKDFVVFSKTKEQLVCIYMSRTFHEDEKIGEVIVPIPCWDVKSRKPFPSTPEDLERHATELQIIYRHSPFKTEADLFAQFDKIESDTGTLVVLVHMKLLDNGEPELDISSDPTDIVMGSEKGLTHEGLVLERRSLRAYTSILYLEPVMKIYIQGVKVQTRRLANCLYKPKQFKFTSTRFKTRAENDAKEAREHAKLAEEKAREAESKYRDLLKRVGSSANRDARSKLNLAKNDAEDYRSEAIYKTKLADQKEKLLKDPKILHLIFGFNIENRSCDGMFMYNCGRLIKMYDRTGPQQDGKVTCSGIVGIVDVPYIVLQPAHNKQDFADGKEYRHLLKVMGEHLLDYWNDSGIIRTGVTEFWESFGYDSNRKWWEPPSDEPRFVKRRQLNIPQAIQCDMCLKWRLLPTSSSSIGKQYPPNWVCQNNPDAQYNRCNAPEQKFSFPLIDRKKLNKDSNGSGGQAHEDKPPVMPSFGRTILQKPDVLPPVKVFKPSPMPVIAPTKLNESPRLLNQTPVPPKRSSVPDSGPSSKIPKKRSPSPDPPSASRSKSSSRQASQQQTARERERPPSRKKSPSPPPTKQKARLSRRSPSPVPEATKKPRKKSPSPEVDKRKSAALLSATASSSKSTSRSRKESPSPVESVTPTPASRSSRISSRVAASEVDESDTQSESSSPAVGSRRGSERPKWPVAVSSKQQSNAKASEQSSPNADFEATVGSEVLVFHSNKWLEATVLEIHSRTKKLKVQFKQKSIPDKWVLPNEVRELREEITSSSSHNAKLKGRERETVTTLSKDSSQKPSDKTPKDSDSKSPKSKSSSAQKQSSEGANTTAQNASMQSTSTGSTPSESIEFQKIVSNFKCMLKHFNPPGWSKTGGDIDSLSNEKLAEFPLLEFYKTYEEGLRELLSRQVQKKVDQQQKLFKREESELGELRAELEHYAQYKAATISFAKRLFTKDIPSEDDSLLSWTSFFRRVEATLGQDAEGSPAAASLNGTAVACDEERVVPNGKGDVDQSSCVGLVNGGSDDSAFEEAESHS